MRRSPRFALLAAAAGAFVFAHDFVAVGIVVPTLQSRFDVGLQTAQWALTLFSIGIAVAVVPAGRLADLAGPRHAFLAGAIGFAAAAALVAVAPTIWLVLAARFLQGVAGGVLWIAAIPLVFAAIGAERPGHAGAFLVGLSGLATALGPVDAGLLIELIDWRAIFAFDAMLGALAAILILRAEPIQHAASTTPIPRRHAASLAATLIIILATLRYAPEQGWTSASSFAGYAVSVLLVVIFVRGQRAAGDAALLPPSLLADRRFSLVLLGEALLGQSYFAVIGLCPLIFDAVLGASTIASGLMLAPSMLIFSLAAALAGRLTPFTRYVVPAAATFTALGGALLALVPESPTYAAFLPGLLLVGLGTGAVFSSLVTLGVSAAPERHKGGAAGVLYLAQLAGGAIGLAAVGALVIQVAGASSPTPAALLEGTRAGFALSAALGGTGIILTLIGYRHLGGPPRLELSGNDKRPDAP